MLLLFLGSGCAALIYEVVWLQMLQLVIGLTSVSLGVLLGTFMGGMCLGSWLLPRFVGRGAHPLKVYALLEIGIGVIGLIELALVPMAGHLYTAVGGSGVGGIIFRAIVAAICLLPPTLLMGATLPAISRWVETSPQGVSWLGFFYGGNIAGAVAGCLLAGFYLLRVFDMATATYVAVVINMVVAAIALVIASQSAYSRSNSEESNKDAAKAPGAGMVYLTIALSGFCALGAEVVWTRLLGLMFGATVYTFSIILAVFLVGLGLGSSAGSLLARTVARPRVALGWCQMLLVLATAWTAYMITKSLPNWPVDPTLAMSPWYTFQLDLARSFWAVLPGACLWGASFPLALAAVAARGQDPGRLVGGVYAANTVGAIFGAIGFSLIVIPFAGTQGGQRVLILMSAISAVVALGPLIIGRSADSEKEADLQQGDMGRAFMALGVAVGLSAAVLFASRVGVVPWGVAAYGRFVATYGSKLAPGIVDEKDVPKSGSNPDTYCEYFGEGLNGTVAVTMKTDGVRSFHSAGKVQASNDPRDMRLQRMLGHISALAFPEPKSVLVVACGAGVTAGSFVPHPSVTRIVICDIEPLVPAHVAPLFKKENYDVVNNGKVTVVRDDGRHFIRTTKEKFDVITSDPIDPWVKGCAALNTIEYYTMCKEHLNPGGVMSLWMPFYESNPATTKSVISTFFKVYPNGILWSNDENGDGYDAVLFGQVEPTRLDLTKIQARLDEPRYADVKKSLDDVGFHSAADLFSTYAGRAADLSEWMKDAQINTDRDLRLQYLAGMWLNTYMGTEILSGITKYYKFPDQVFAGSEEEMQKIQERLKYRERPKK
jgi:spermidine synthase